ncbi:MAG: ABC transporter permease [Candidatus Bathyarchaeota archaeon]|nr:ABC transporter permease [Candidatus Bathyarchaeota archaeon]
MNGVKERKFRFALNLVGILIGCAAVTGLVSMTQGLTDSVTGQLDVFGPTNIIVIPGDITHGPPGMGSVTLGWRELQIIERTPKLEAVTPIVANKFCEFTFQGRFYRTDVYGVTPEYAEINKNTKIDEGRNFISSDTAVVAIGANIAKPLDSEEQVIELGDRIKIKVQVKGEEKELTLRVISILQAQGSSFGFNLDDSISIPLATAQQLYEIGGEFDFILGRATSIDDVNSAVEAIEEKLGDRVTAISYASAQDQVGSILGTIQSVLGGIAGISLLVAGVGIINTMMVSVMERTKEIGTMKAVGAKSLDVLLMFLSEAMITGLIGGIVGSLFGFALGGAIGRYINLAVEPSLSLGLFVVGFAMTTSVISGLYPAWRASSLSPVEALRHE